MESKVTEHTYEELLHKVQLYEALLNTLPTDLVVFNSLHQYEFINKTAIKNDDLRNSMLGQDDFEYCKKRGLDLNLAEYRRSKFKEAVKKKSPVYWEEENNKSGKKEVISRLMYPIFDETNSDIKYVLGYGFDITRFREQYEYFKPKDGEIETIVKGEGYSEGIEIKNKRILESKSSFSDENPNPVLRINLSGDLIFANKAAINTFGSKFAIQKFCDVELSGVINNSKSFNQRINFEYKVESEFFSFSVVPFLENEYINIYAINISELKLAEAKLSQLNKGLEKEISRRIHELKESNNQLEKFTSLVSHDLRAPLRQIVGFINIIKRKTEQYITPELEEYFRFVTSSINTANDKIEALYRFSKYSHKVLEYNNFEIQKVFKNAISLYQEYYQVSEVISKVDVTYSVDGDEALVSLVIDNLISNAFKYSKGRNNFELKVCQFENDSHYIFEVKDNGFGFDMKEYDKIFEIFGRTQNATKDFSGQGIGLYHSKKIIEKHGGQLWANSQLNVGSNFYFSLPKSVNR